MAFSDARVPAMRQPPAATARDLMSLPREHKRPTEPPAHARTEAASGSYTPSFHGAR